MQAFLHIGLAKTGSTLIQRFLKANRLELEARGFSPRYSTRDLLDYGLGAGPEVDFAGDHHTLIYSDERLSSRLDGEQVRAVVSLVRRYCKDVRVIAYVRRQDEVFVSAYSTMLISGETRRLGEIDPVPLQRPYKQIRHWEAVLSRSDVFVRRFGPGYLPKGLLADFCKLAGIDAKGLEFPGPANVSPPADVLELMRLLNLRFSDHPGRRRMLKSVAEFAGGGPALGLSRPVRERINARSLDEDARVARRYMGRDTLFDHPVPDNANHDVVLEPDAIVRLLRAGGGERCFAPPPRPGAAMDAVLDWVASSIALAD